MANSHTFFGDDMEDKLDCTFLCVIEPKCYSFNIAVYPDSKGLYLLELLATDKYREAEKVHAMLLSITAVRC